MRRLAVGGVVVVLNLSLSGQAALEDARFEVASVKPSLETFGGYYRPTPTGFTTTSSVAEMVMLAYQLPRFRVVGGEEWTRNQRFDVNARISGTRTPGDFWFMLRNLLRDRFALRVHREQRPTSVFALMLVRTDGTFGPNFTRVDRSCPPNPQKIEERCFISEAVGTYRSTCSRSAVKICSSVAVSGIRTSPHGSGSNLRAGTVDQHSPPLVPERVTQPAKRLWRLV